jgi:hypothetical protein
MGGAIVSAAQDIWELLVQAWNAPWGPFAGVAAVLIALLFLKRGKLLAWMWPTLLAAGIYWAWRRFRGF